MQARVEAGTAVEVPCHSETRPRPRPPRQTRKWIHRLALLLAENAETLLEKGRWVVWTGLCQRSLRLLTHIFIHSQGNIIEQPLFFLG